MLRYFLPLMILLFACAGPGAQFSAFTLRFLNDLEHVERQNGAPVLDASLKAKYLVRNSDQGDVVHGFLRLTPDFDPESLERLGVQIQSQSGEICTAVIPVRSLRKLGKVKGITYIEINSPLSPLQKSNEASL